MSRNNLNTINNLLENSNINTNYQTKIKLNYVVEILKTIIKKLIFQIFSYIIISWLVNYVKNEYFWSFFFIRVNDILNNLGRLQYNLDILINIVDLDFNKYLNSSLPNYDNKTAKDFFNEFSNKYFENCNLGDVIINREYIDKSKYASKSNSQLSNETRQYNNNSN